MRLRKVSGCEGGECPAVYLSDKGTLVIQGNRADAGNLRLSSHEGAVEVPIGVVFDAVTALTGGTT